MPSNNTALEETMSTQGWLVFMLNPMNLKMETNPEVITIGGRQRAYDGGSLGRLR